MLCTFQTFSFSVVLFFLCFLLIVITWYMHKCTTSYDNFSKCIAVCNPLSAWVEHFPYMIIFQFPVYMHDFLLLFLHDTKTLCYLDSYTISAARASFLDKDLGSLSPGKLADFVILSTDSWKDFAEDASAYMLCWGSICFWCESLSLKLFHF